MTKGGEEVEDDVDKIGPPVGPWSTSFFSFLHKGFFLIFLLTQNYWQETHLLLLDHPISGIPAGTNKLAKIKFARSQSFEAQTQFVMLKLQRTMDTGHMLCWYLTFCEG